MFKENEMIKTPTLLCRLAAGAATALLAGVPLTAQATPKMMSHGKMSHKTMAGKTVYACTMCKEYYTPAQAKKMSYKDPMGHTLTKMSKAPAGFTDGSKMGGNMGSNMGGKM